MTAGQFHYNPDWSNDDDLVSNFVARLDLFNFLRNELARAPLHGNVQHYLLVGLRGAGKTTLLKRIATAIRRDADLNNHLIALSFPEELYQVKNYADFWWAACDALIDELDRQGRKTDADHLADAVEDATRDKAKHEPLNDGGFKLLQQTCHELGRRPVLLVDNLDLVFQRIDKTGRKLKDPHAPAYWALREALSTMDSPIVIGGSVRLSEPFTDYDKAFYDFFLPKRLAKLSLAEVKLVLERLAEARQAPDVKKRLEARPARIETLYQLTGGNPRAIGLIFELLNNGGNSRAVQDFERLMDLTTPYYKARFEELSEQAQVITHALAVRRPVDATGSGLRFGHTAAEIAAHAGLPTNSVSAQLDILEHEGIVEKNAGRGRTQYRIAEQLFRLWLQMRGNRRVRQNVIGLAEFLEALYDYEETSGTLRFPGSALADAKLAFALADTHCSEAQKRGAEAHGADRLLYHLNDSGGELNQYLPSGDLPLDLAALAHMREQLQRCPGGLSSTEQEALLGALELSMEEKQAAVNTLSDPDLTDEEAAKLRTHFEKERAHLLHHGLLENDLPPLYQLRTKGFLPLPSLTPADADVTAEYHPNVSSLFPMVWRLIGTSKYVQFGDESLAQQWFVWGLERIRPDISEWLRFAETLEIFGFTKIAAKALARAIELIERERETKIWKTDVLYLGQATTGLEIAAPPWKPQFLATLTRIHTSLSRKAFEAGDIAKLHETLQPLVLESADIFPVLASDLFVEGFLTPTLRNQAKAKELLNVLRSLGLARPLLLAFEAAISEQPERLKELAPEVQDAAQHLYARLREQSPLQKNFAHPEKHNSGNSAE